MMTTRARQPLNRRPRRRFFSLGLALTAGVAVAAAAADLDLVIAGVTGGGGRSTGDDVVVIGAVAQPISSTSRGGTVVIEAGVLAGARDSGRLFTDGFETGTVTTWSSWQGGELTMHILIRPALFIVIMATAAAAATEPITYQGRLTDGGAPPSGLYDMTIRAWTELIGGVPVGNEIVLTEVPVEDGYFSLELDFGDLVLAAGDRWIEMAVRPQGGSSWTFLTPRQPVRAVPRSTVADYGVHSVSVGPDLATTGDPQAVYITLSNNFLQRIADLENLVASQGFAITNLLNEIQTLQSEVDALTVDVAEAQGRIAAVEGITDSMELTSIDGYPSLVVEGVNIHLRNGLGGTSTDNGLGNFVLGYNESRADPADNIRTGSHIVVTGREQNYEGSSGFLDGYQNSLNADYGSILSGFSNEVYGLASAVVGGLFNTAGNQSDPNDAFYAVAVGGYNNIAKARGGSILAGQNNVTLGIHSAIVAGNSNQATGARSAVVSGFSNQANGSNSVVVGGGIQTTGVFGDTGLGDAAVIVGGYRNESTGTYATTVGGFNNKSSNTWTVTSSGAFRDAAEEGQWVSSSFSDSDFD